MTELIQALRRKSLLVAPLAVDACKRPWEIQLEGRNMHWGIPQQSAGSQEGNRPPSSEQARGGVLVSKYTYQHDALGRRSNVQHTGSAFSEPAHTVYDYNDRNELTSAHRYLGLVGDETRPVAEQDREYGYDQPLR